MTPLRVLAVDDEPLALRRLEIALDQIGDVRLIGTARSGGEALDLLARERIDVILLDIRMAGIDGFGVLDRLPEGVRPTVIFVTAYDAFAARAFEVAAVDYILKPVEFGRLAAALDRARARRDADSAAFDMAELRAVIANLRAHGRAPAVDPRFESEFWVETRAGFVRVGADAIRWIESEGDYVRLNTAQAAYLLRETITAMADRLDPRRFMRIRRSAIVRLPEIESVRRAGYGDLRVQLSGGPELRVGRTYQKAVRAFMGAVA